MTNLKEPGKSTDKMIDLVINLPSDAHRLIYQEGYKAGVERMKEEVKKLLEAEGKRLGKEQARILRGFDNLEL